MTVSETSPRPPSPSELADMPPLPPPLVRQLNPNSALFDESLRKAYEVYGKMMNEVANLPPSSKRKRINPLSPNQPESP